VLAARGYLAGYFLAAAAGAEYVMDLLPNTPSRTQLVGVSARVLSGAFSGYVLAGIHGGPALWCAVAGIAGSLVGTYGGHAARLGLIQRIGAVPAALAEDAVAIALAIFIVTR
jgi:uncharacterized membrane protein